MIGPIRCEVCGRIRYAIGQDWEDHPGRIEGEVLGFCATCKATRQGRERRAYYAAVRRTRRRLAHREPWAEGTTPSDPFKGMREPQSR